MTSNYCYYDMMMDCFDSGGWLLTSVSINVMSPLIMCMWWLSVNCVCWLSVNCCLLHFVYDLIYYNCVIPNYIAKSTIERDRKSVV